MTVGTDAEYGYNAPLETHDVAWLASEVRLQVMRREQAERERDEARLEAARTAETILTEVATHLRARATNPRVVSGKYRIEGWLQAVDAMERAGHGQRQFWETATAQAEVARHAPHEIEEG